MDVTKVQCWLHRDHQGMTLFFARPDTFATRPNWKRLRVSQKGRYWSGMFEDQKYRVPFEAVPNIWFGPYADAGSAEKYTNAEPPLVAASVPSGGGATLEELFAIDGE